MSVEVPGAGRHLRVGVDVGGTFTDVLLLDERTGAFQVAKNLTTPDDPTRGILRALQSVLNAAKATVDEVKDIVHGTTLVTNALIERRGAPTALLTTRGFRDVLDIRREHRYDMYDLLLVQPGPLVPRDLRYEIDERVLADGTVHRAVDLDSVDAAASDLAARGIRSVAVVFLHAYRNPTHERLVQERLRQRLPDVRTSLSSDVAGEIREYERTSTTAANAYVQELVERYLRELLDELRQGGFAGELLIMLSNGGVATVDVARRFPVRMIESGPAAGALAAAHAARLLGLSSLLSFDMGGTTAKSCLIDDGHPSTTNEFEVDRIYRFKAGSGLPIRAPAIEMIEIGAGGGSIARVDQFGLIKVGPESAGASPGPVAYGLGGTSPTVTDADLVLGYLDPEFFLGGTMRLDRDAAERAIQRHVGVALGLSTLDAAWAIHRIVNESMAAAARIHAVEKGKDVTVYPLYAFGGAGPVHAYRVAEILGVTRIIAPVGAGVGSTFGFLAAPLAFDLVRGAAGLLDRLDWDEIDRLYREMEDEGRSLLADAGVARSEVQIRRTAEMRLSGQAHQIAVPIPSGRLSREQVERVTAAFHRTYLDLFKRAAPGVAVEALNWRVRVSGPPPEIEPVTSATTSTRRAIKSSRPIYLPEQGERVAVPVYDRYALVPGDSFDGPAVVEERESTLVIGPRGRAAVDSHGNVVVDLASHG